MHEYYRNILLLVIRIIKQYVLQPEFIGLHMKVLYNVGVLDQF
jgi:hypothetical protein